MTHQPQLGVAVTGTGMMGAVHVRRIDQAGSGARGAAAAVAEAGGTARAQGRRVAVDMIERRALYTEPPTAMA